MSNLKVGLQLYSLRGKMEQDMDGTLKAVKEMGYDYVEFAGYFGKSAEEVKAILDKYDLKCISVHQRYDAFLNDPVASVEFIKKLGVKYSAIPWMGPENHKGQDNFENAMEEIRTVSKLLKDNDIKLLYHNHEFEFETYEGKFLMDWLYDTLGTDVLEPEIDTCWVRYAGYDPCEYLRKYTGKINIVHLKDFVCKSFAGGPVYALIDGEGNQGKKATREDNGFRFKHIGAGMQDFASIIKASEDAGAEYVIVEQDEWYDDDSLELARRSREYLRGLGL
ncbi:MAG: sugar phosphate isomerase/epimerase [Clostridia bacterium]|nr:sugar phosphate isomerase/epimerase [Clostridia bacterium]